MSMRNSKKLLERRRLRFKQICRGMMPEMLENRLMFSLGTTPVLDVPDLRFAGGTFSYDGVHVATSNTIPIAFDYNPDITADINLAGTGSPPAALSLSAQVDSSGNLVPSAGNTLSIDGALDVDANGNPTGPAGHLLSATITKFEAGPFQDYFFFQIHITGGLLQSNYEAASNSDDALVTLINDASTFSGSFDQNFTGGAEGFIQPFPPDTTHHLPNISISGTKFNDLSGDGFSNDDTPLAGVTINLYQGTSSAGSLVASLPTLDGGIYTFGGLAAGDYFVQETVPLGWTQTGGTNGYVVHATADGDYGGNNFDNFQNISISGTKYNDANGDGATVGDATLGGVSVNLYLNGGSTPIESTTTSSTDGSYSFSNLGPGTYTVKEAVPSGWTQTLGAAGYVVNAGSGVNSTGDNFADFKNVTITGTKYNDLNGDGVQEAGEGGLGGWTFDLTDSHGVVKTATSANVNGTFTFTNVGPGTYTVAEEGQAGWVQTSAPSSYSITTASGVDSTGNNFGNFQLGQISGGKFTDRTGDGFSADDTALAGVTINLYQGTSAGGVFIKSFSTRPDGTYGFDNLTAGDYFVQETVPTGWTQTGGNAGYGVHIASGVTSASNNFDDFQNITISGTKYNDISGTGFANDATYAGPPVTINLLKNNVTVATTTTGPAGVYSFSNLGPGIYTVQEMVPSGWVKTAETAATISASSGANSTGNNFADFQLGAISGTKLQDNNGQGFSNDSAYPVTAPAVTIQLWQGNAVAYSTTTDSNGNYSLSGLLAGAYTLKEIVPAGWIETAQTTASITVTSGFISSGNNFADFKLGQISGVKFQDNDGSGFANDSAYAGPAVTINLLKGNAVVSSTVTGTGGAYSFTNLGPGVYSVQEVVPSGWVKTAETAATISAGSGFSSTGNNFADFQLIGISGRKFTDITGNGYTSDDTALGGVTINLFKNGGATPVASATTSAVDGGYAFSNLGPGTYSVQEVVPAGWTQTLGNAGYSIQALSGQNSTGDNFADFQNITISGAKYNDLNGNGSPAGDPTLGGVTINLYRNGGSTPVASAITSLADGSYQFSNLGPGTYSVQEAVPAGWVQTYGAAGYSVSATSGQVSRGNNFADFQLINIGGRKFTDITGNGYTADDTFLGGVTINLYKNGAATPFSTAVTSSVDGSYLFANLGPGTYSVQEAVPAGWTQTFGGAGYGIVATSGQSSSGNNFADFKNITISGIKYNDITGNSFSADDTALAGVTINLTKVGVVGVIATAVTGADGSYSFPNLGPGTYFVQEVVPTGWVQTGGNAGYTVPATSGLVATNKNFDDFQLLTISGVKYQDLTGNGFSCDDTPLGGVTIKLYKDVNNDGLLTSADGAPIATAVTAAGTGGYSFTGLASGTYFVQEVVPTGWISTGPTSVSYYTVKTGTAKAYTGNNFDNFFEECKLSNTSCYYYTINNCTTHYTTLHGNVHEGDQVTVWFNLLSPDTISLVSYTAPENTFVAADAYKQVIFDQATGSFGAGWHSLTVTVPLCYFQIDFVCGPVIDHFGPAGGNIFYGAQGRLFDADNDGTESCFTGGAELSGYVFNDVNRNKSFGAGDTGIAGVLITLTGTDSNGHAVKLTRLTASDGSYLFQGLRAGTYALTETQPTGYTDSVDLVGTVSGVTDGTVKANDQLGNIVLKLTSDGINYDFAEIKTVLCY